MQNCEKNAILANPQAKIGQKRPKKRLNVAIAFNSC